MGKAMGTTLMTISLVTLMGWFANSCTKESNHDKKPNVHSLSFDASGWKKRESSDERIIWVNKDDDTLSLDFVEGSPDLPALSDTGSVRDSCREIAKGNDGGIVCGDVIDIGGIPGIELIYKREDGLTYAYTGILMIPFKRFSYTLAIASRQRGMTGARDAYVSAKLLQEGKLELELYEEPDSSGAAGRMKGWFQDPYDPEYEGIVLRSVADDEGYDSLFPTHPLSKVRRMLKQIRGSIEYEDRILREIN